MVTSWWFQVYLMGFTSDLASLAHEDGDHMENYGITVGH